MAAENREFVDAASAVLKGVLMHIDGLLTKPITLRNLVGTMKAKIEQWQELLGRFVVDRATPIQLALIQVLGAHCLTLPHWKNAFAYGLQWLYDSDVLTDDAIVLWHANETDADETASEPAADDEFSESAPRLSLRELALQPSTTRVVEGMQEDSEEESSDESESGSESESASESESLPA